MKILVTNLSEQTARKAFMVEQLDKLNHDYDIITCIDGRKWEDDFIATITSPRLFDMRTRHTSWLTKGAIAATLTQITILLKKMLDEGHQYMMIMEDDVALSPDFSFDFLNSLEKKLIENKTKGVILLHSTSTEVQYLAAKSKVSIDSRYAIYKPEKINMGSGAAYIMDKDTAKALIEAQTPLDKIGDWWGDHVAQNTIENIYVMYPQPTKTNIFESTLGYIKPKTKLEALKKILKSNFISHAILKAYRSFKAKKHKNIIVR